MYKKAWCTCRAVVLLIKPISFWRSRCRRHHGFVRSLVKWKRHPVGCRGGHNNDKEMVWTPTQQSTVNRQDKSLLGFQDTMSPHYCSCNKIITKVEPWFSQVTPKPLYENEHATAFWDVPLFADTTQVKADRIDATVIDKTSKQVRVIEISCPWLENRES